MPSEYGLPPYVSRHAKTGLFQYYRRPPTGVKGPAFVRSFATKDKRVMVEKYGAVHAEAEAYFARMISGRSLTDRELGEIAMSRETVDALYRAKGLLNEREDWENWIAANGNPRMKTITGPDRDRMILILGGLYAGTETLHLALARNDFQYQAEYVRERFGSDAVAPSKDSFTLTAAFEQAWKPAATRSNNTVVEVVTWTSSVR